MEIHIAEDLDTAPEKQFVKDYNLAFAEADTEKVLAMMTDDATWTLVGDKTYNGKTEIRAALDGMGMSVAKELRIDNIIGRGNKCAANGTMVFDDSKVGFCDIYQFTSDAADAKIKQLISYGVEIK